jgi:YaaC-like Protein
MNDFNYTWGQFGVFFSSETTQSYLDQCYKKHSIHDSEKKSFANCYPFIYYLEHAKNYYSLSEVSPLPIKPTLLFYGMTQLMKACLLTVDPNYPESTIVLAHGVTTRKRKKQQYEFLQDEVKTQKNGLFTHMAEKLFGLSCTEGEKYGMEELLGTIPEMLPLFILNKQKKGIEEIHVDDYTLRIPLHILDIYHMTSNRFMTYLTSVSKQLKIGDQDPTSSYLIFNLKQKLNTYNSYPFVYDSIKKTFYLSLRKEKELLFPEMLIHYLILYNLSIISRYETEWWYHLLHNYETRDFPFITHFLSISASKIPILVYDFLQDMQKKN